MAATSVQKKAAEQQRGLGGFNAASTVQQLDRTLEDFNLADRQNKALADVQLEANSKQSAADRFSQAKKLQSSTKGILGAAGNALQGSQMGSLAGLIRDRTDLDTGEVLGTLAQNQAAVNNNQSETKNTNLLARRDAINTAAFGLRGIEADTAAALSNINPDLYASPESINLGSTAIGDRRGWYPENVAKAAGYFLPEASKKAPATAANPGIKMQGSSYFDKLLNTYNQRRA